MAKLAFLLVLLGVSLSPLDARELPAQDERIERRDGGELRRDIERISKEIYVPTRGSGRPAPRDGRRSPRGPR